MILKVKLLLASVAGVALSVGGWGIHESFISKASKTNKAPLKNKEEVAKEKKEIKNPPESEKDGEKLSKNKSKKSPGEGKLKNKPRKEKPPKSPKKNRKP